MDGEDQDDRLDQTPANRAKLAQLREAMGRILSTALHRGFYGTVSIELTVADGTVQKLTEGIHREER